MDTMKIRSRLAALVLAATAALAAAACGGGGAGEDKAGGSGKAVVLRLANTNGELSFSPAVEYFAQRVSELSGGDLRIESVDAWAESAPDAEQRVVRAVAGGEIDLGWVGTRAFDTLGIKTFQALTAPMLIDSYALQGAVIESGITKQMLQGLDELGVVGLGVLPDGLRKPIGASGPIVGPADWRGITFGIFKSNGHAEAIRALGATPAQIHWLERERRLENGTLRGFETSIRSHQRNPALVYLSPYVTSNVTLWPLMDVLLADPARLEALTAEQREWLEQATRDAASHSAALADQDREALGKSCASGARFAEASPADLAALEAAFGPVYTMLQQHPETKAFIARIRALKQSTTPEPSLVIPSDCTGEAPQQAPLATETAPSHLNGTYRYVLTQADADKVGDTERYPQVITITLKDGNLKGGCFGALGGTYSVDDDRITFHSIEYGSDLTVTFSQEEKGELDLTPVQPMEAGDQFTCFYKPWTKIAGADAAQSAIADLNGTYRFTLTKEDARKAGESDLSGLPRTSTWILDDGRFDAPGGFHGSYSVEGNRIIIEPVGDYTTTWTFTVDEEGNIDLDPVPPVDAGAAFEIGSHTVWTKID